jgi:Terminase large subunit, T4likevirus-type, N-terminal
MPPLGVRDRIALRAIDAAFTPYRERILLRERDALSRYALDPWALPEEGGVRLQNPGGREVVFRPYAHQKELAAAWIDLDTLQGGGSLRFRNLHEEKSRQMGITWAFAWIVLWLLRFHPVHGLMLHRKFQEVDDGGRASTTDSFVGKIRYMQERMREELRPTLSYRASAGKSIVRNDGTGAFLQGEGATPDPGRGGTFDYAILDEAARIPWSESVHQSVSRACPSGRAYNSTPFGHDNVYYRLRVERPRGYRFLTHHWSLHPEYSRGLHVAGQEPATCDLCAGVEEGVPWTPKEPATHRYPGKLAAPWYDQAVIELTDEQVAQELDIDYAGSLSARVYSEFTEAVHVSPEPIPYDARLPLELGFDYGLETTAVPVCQDHPHEYRVIGEVEVSDLTPDQVAPLIRETLRDLGVRPELLSPDLTRTILCVGDPSGESRETATGRPIAADYRRQGFSIASQVRGVQETINAVKRLLMGRPKPLAVSPTCERFISHMQNNRWPVDRLGQRKPGASAPLNDRHNHMMRAFAYLAAYKFPPPVEPTTATSLEVTAPSGLMDEDLSYDMSF